MLQIRTPHMQHVGEILRDNETAVKYLYRRLASIKACGVARESNLGLDHMLRSSTQSTLLAQ